MELNQKNKGIDDALNNGADPQVHSGEAAQEKVDEIFANAVSSKGFPKPLDNVAYHGIAGAIIKMILPHTEADPVALLLHFLVAIGNIFGRSPHFEVSGARHGTNLFAVFVGDTSNGKKGTAWAAIKFFLRSVAETWLKERVTSGSSSGEGWIWLVRDAIKKTVIHKEGSEEQIADPGVADKRALVIESEFATLLKVILREGNTLSDIVRKAWDGEDLNSLTKNSPARSTNPHISMIGHITKNELNKYISETEAANGFGNRILWICVKRSKLLPNGGDLRSVDFTEISERLKEIIHFASSAKLVSKHFEIEDAWRKVYSELNCERYGLLGAMCARATPQVLRLAMMYALLDQTTSIQKVHLEAALAILEYTESSCQYIFGDSLGDPVVDKILSALRQAPNGLTRTEIRDLFNRNMSAGKIDVALEQLQREGHAYQRFEDTLGRSTERWVSTEKATFS